MTEQNWSSLIDFSKIPRGAIAGKEDHEIEAMAQTQRSDSNDHNLCPRLSDDIEKELNEAEISMRNKETVVLTERYIKMFCNFLSENDLSTELCNMPTDILNDYLRFFHSKLLTKEGNFYSPTTLLCIRCALQRHFTDLGKKSISQRMPNLALQILC